MVAVTDVRWSSNNNSRADREDVGSRTSIFALRRGTNLGRYNNSNQSTRQVRVSPEYQKTILSKDNYRLLGGNSQVFI